MVEWTSLLPVLLIHNIVAAGAVVVSPESSGLALCLLPKLGHRYVYVISFINTPNNTQAPYVLMCI